MDKATTIPQHKVKITTPPARAGLPPYVRLVIDGAEFLLGAPQATELGLMLAQAAAVNQFAAAGGTDGASTWQRVLPGGG